MVEHYLEQGEIKKLNEILPLYIKKRNEGMTAGYISKKTGIPLKDVISFLIEKKVITGEQVDLELVRVMIERNPELQNAITQNSNSTIKEIDNALATSDSDAIRKMGCESEFQQSPTFSFIPQVLIFGGLINLPMGIIFSMCMTIAGVIFMQLFDRMSSKSNIEIITRMLEGC